MERAVQVGNSAYHDLESVQITVSSIQSAGQTDILTSSKYDHALLSVGKSCTVK